jgi:hypothetical protein
VISEWRFWMGAGIVALGAGAALASGSAVAHADSAGGSSTAAHNQKHTAGPAARPHSTPSAGKVLKRTAVGRVNATADNAITDQDKAIAEEKKAITEQKKEFGQDVRHIVTTTNFSAFSPEVNNTRLYAGAGSAALLQAASAWNNLADELNAAAQGVDWVSERLGSGPWAGPASAAMAAATPPVAGWLITAASKAESAAAQASAVAAVFDAALVANVSPPASAANRAILLQLTAVNFLSGNVPAMLATDLMYEEMWAQDVGAMLGYYAP